MTPERVEERLRAALPPAEAPEALWERIEAALPAATLPEAPRKRASHRARWLAPALGLAAAAVALGWLWRRPAPTLSGWTLSGKRLRVGERVHVGSSRLMLREPSIGDIALMPRTRLRIADARGQKRLTLEEGTLSATVVAPPRLFVVETPNAIATDLGCAYQLSTSPHYRWRLGPLRWGRTSATRLDVTSGWVELADRKSGAVLVPAGAKCYFGPGLVGTPYFKDADKALIRALNTWRDGKPDIAGALAAPARPKDSLSLFYLLPHASAAERERLFEKLAALAPPPTGVTEETIRNRDKAALERWRESMREVWYPPVPKEVIEQLLRFGNPLAEFGGK